MSERIETTDVSGEPLGLTVERPAGGPDEGTPADPMGALDGVVDGDPTPESLPPFGLASDVLGELAASVPRGPESILQFADAMASVGDTAATKSHAGEFHLVTCDLDREEFGIPITRVREIIRVGAITRVPDSPPHVRGVANLRGRIIPVIEIRTRLGLPPAHIDERSRVLVVEANQRLLGLLVDAVNQVIKIPVASVSAPPEEVLTAATDYVVGVGRMGERLVILLDIDKALVLRAA